MGYLVNIFVADKIEFIVHKKKTSTPINDERLVAVTRY